MATAIRYFAYPVTMLAVLGVVLAVLSGNWAPWPALACAAAAGIGGVALLERRLPFEPAWLADHADTRADVVHALVNWALLSAGAWVVSLGSSFADLPAIWPRHWPLVSQLVAVAIIFDVGLYAMHVLSHRWPTAWRLHAIHHSAERLYWLNGERRHPLSAGLMAAPGIVLLALIGAPPIVVSAWLTVVAVHLAFQHANLDYRLGALRRWIAGAETHRWHHKREYEDAQVNFGEFLLVWDRIFGTFAEPASPLRANDVGLRYRSVPARYLAQLTWPFVMPAELRLAFDQHLRDGRLALDAGRHNEAMSQFEAAHILSQAWTWPHVRSHVALLRWAYRTGQRRELVGQVARIAAAILFTWLWVPRGNPGSTRVGALVRQPIPRDLASLMARAGS